MKSKLFFLTAPLLLVALLVSGCNILSWTSGENTETLIDEGKRLMRDGDYDGAISAFAAAMAEDPYNSDALYLHSKATVHGSGFNALNLADEVSETQFVDGSLLPFFGAAWPVPRADSLYQTMLTVQKNLRLIIQGSTHGSFDSADVDLDYGLASGFGGILKFRDSNNDSLINEFDFETNIIYVTGGNTGFAINDLVGYFDFYMNPAKKIAPGKISVEEDIPQNLIDQFNGWIDNIEELIKIAVDIIKDLLDLDDSELDLTEIQDALDKAISIASYYKIADGEDNDDDGRTDEEIIDGLDNDGDGWIDEDSNGKIDFNPTK